MCGFLTTFCFTFPSAEQGAQRLSAASPVETIVFFRHGEKPAGSLGQLNCQGLNRALALPDVLISKFGKPDYLFAPDPEEKVTAGEQEFNYVRPLATIEPTAIRLGMPVNTNYGFTEIDELEAELTNQIYGHALIFVAWEHVKLAQLVKNIVQAYAGDPAQVPDWKEADYDSLYVLRIRGYEPFRSISFTHDHEALNNLSADCPNAKFR